MSVSVYSPSGSPTTPTGRKESPVPREASPPVVSASGEPVPTQSSYGTMSFLPMISPIRDISFFDTELPSRGHSRTHSRSQSDFPFMLHSQPEEDDSHIHPLLRESRQEPDRSTELSGTQDKSSHNVLHPYTNYSSTDLADSTGPTQQQPNPSARELREHKNSAAHPDASNGGKNAKEDVSNTNNITELASRPTTENRNKTPQKISLSTQEINSKKRSQEISRAPLSDSEKLDRDLIRSHHLLYAAMSKSENDLTDPNHVVPSIKAEPKSTSSTFHPLLEEVRHKKFASKMVPLAPPRKITGDLPLRNYRSQESMLSQDLRSSRDDDISRTSHKRSSSVYQRGSRQFSSPLASSPQRASVFYSATEPSPPPTSHLAILPNRTATQYDDLAQPAQPDVTASPPTELPDTSKILKQATVESPAAGSAGAHLTASKNDTAESEKKISSSAENQVVNTASAASQESGSTSNLSNEKYKTSATTNAPFYLNPVSSAALLEFLAETPPTSPANPNKTHNLPPEATVTSQPVQRDPSENKPSNAAPPPPPSSWQVPSGPPGPPPSGPPPSVPRTSSGPPPPPGHPPPSGILSMAPGALPPAITRPVVPPPPPGPPPTSGLFSVAPGALPPAIARPPPPGTVSNLSSPSQSAAPKKSSGLKKFFGVGSSSNTSSGTKKEKHPKGPLVIGEPQLIVVPSTATKKEKGKAKTSKTSKKGGEGERSQHDESGIGNGNDKDNSFMGVGKDGVWISRQNFVKT